MTSTGLKGTTIAFLGAVVIGGGSIAGGLAMDEALSNVTPTTTPKALVVKEDDKTPEVATGFINKAEVTAKDYMMVAAHPAAAQIGAQILSEGGSALDAAMAAQIALNLVEPQSSGIGGGAFMLYWDNQKQTLHTYDGRETAPMAVDRKLFFNADGSPRKFMEAVVGGASIGVPGLLRMFELARNDHGGRPLTDLFQPTIDLARRGFPISPRLHRLLSKEKHMSPGMAAHHYFFDEDGQPKQPGTILKNDAFAETLETIARDGIDSFYAGEIARDIVEAVHSAPGNPGNMSLDDLANYKAKKRDNLCAVYRIKLVCGMPPPSSGGLTVLQILGILENTEIADQEPMSPPAIQTFAEAMRLAHADRDQYIADSDFVDVPVRGLINRGYLAARAVEVDKGFNTKVKVKPGIPPSDNAASLAPDDSIELPSTTHLVAVDKAGNVVSMTSSIENGFGSRQMVRGFLLNNQLTDFARHAIKDGLPIQNRIEPGKRPRSSMAPTMVFDENGEIILALGSPGGSRIIGYVAKSLVGVFDWGMSLQEAVSMPHFINRNSGLDLEDDTDLAALNEVMTARGYDVNVRGLNSGLHGVMIDGDTLHSGVDPRREGYAIGEANLLPDVDAAFDLVLPVSPGAGGQAQ